MQKPFRTQFPAGGGHFQRFYKSAEALLGAAGGKRHGALGERVEIAGGKIGIMAKEMNVHCGEVAHGIAFHAGSGKEEQMPPDGNLFSAEKSGGAIGQIEFNFIIFRHSCRPLSVLTVAGRKTDIVGRVEHRKTVFHRHIPPFRRPLFMA